MPSPSQARIMWRSLARGMVEPHPFARNPITMAPHAWRAGDLGRRLVKTSSVYVFPFTYFFTYLSIHPPTYTNTTLYTYTCNLLTYSPCRYFPFYAVILGWPVAAAWYFNGNM
ncbi:hypothetical protein ACJQWK_01500 [Exserohilum turcicum]